MQMTQITDELTLVRAAQADVQAFGALYDHYVQRIYRFCYYRTNNKADAEDLTAQIFLAVLEGLPHYRQEGHFAGWVFSIARNKINDHHRRVVPIPLDEADLLPLNADLEINAEISQRKERLLNLIQMLTDDEREIIHLRYVAELTFAEIAQAMKKNEDAVKKMLYRLVARLKEKLEADYE